MYMRNENWTCDKENNPQDNVLRVSHIIWVRSKESGLSYLGSFYAHTRERERKKEEKSRDRLLRTYLGAIKIRIFTYRTFFSVSYSPIQKNNSVSRNFFAKSKFRILI